MTRVAYATYLGRDRLEGVDDELELAVAALRARGLDAEPAAWDDPGVDWAAYDAVLVRSTWDYATRRDQYLAWARGVAEATRLLNPYEVIERNTDKRYLRDLAARGISVVPTTWVLPGEMPLALPPGEVVVKPNVSAGARDTVRTSDTAQARAHADAIVAGGRAAMVQPFLSEVGGEGEIALVYLGGRFSHAVRKAPALGEVAGEAVAAEADVDLRTFADSVLDAVPERDQLVYARVDAVRVGGEPMLMELELTEPSLFLGHAEGAADRFADAVLEALARSAQ